MAEALLMLFALAFMPHSHTESRSPRPQTRKPQWTKPRKSTDTALSLHESVPESRKKRAGRTLRHELKYLRHKADGKKKSEAKPDHPTRIGQRSDLPKKEGKRSTSSSHTTSSSTRYRAENATNMA
jgi:hypothetical protein